MGGTSVGADLAPAVAARLGTGLTAHCTDLHIEAIDGRDQLVMVVPGWRGNMMVKIVCPEKRPVMATIRPGVMEKGGADPSRRGRSSLSAPISARRTSGPGPSRWSGNRKRGRWNRRKSSCLQGSAFTRQAAFPSWIVLPRALGGVTAGSRPACDAGWVPETRMIGQSGRTVNPDLFISIGASGAPHYTTGFAKSKFIVAVDKNPKAPIFDIADIGIAGDLREIIPALVEELEGKG